MRPVPRMTRNPRRLTLAASAAAAALLLAGCAAHPAAPTNKPALAAAPATQPAPPDPKADVPLAEVEPAVKLPAPTTRPAGAAPLDAIVAYAKARAATVDNQRFAAINWLERAASIDPFSFDVQFDLARAYLSTSPNGTANDRALAAFEKAAALQPDRLDLQYELGRQYLDRNSMVKALQHLLLARQTSDYASQKRPDVAALVDFQLARALRLNGYTGAALEQYVALLNRLAKPAFSSHSNPQLLALRAHPQVIYVEVGEVYEKRGQYAEALQAYEAALGAEQDNPELIKRVVRLCLQVGKGEEARSRAAALVARLHGSADSLELLRDVHRQLGDPQGVRKTLAKLHQDQPNDRLVFYALLDQLKSDGKADEAERLLLDATRASGSDPDFTRRLFALYQSRGDIEASMRLLVSSLADRPDALPQIGALWAELLRPARSGKLRLRVLQDMSVPPREEAARLFWVSRLADVWHRDALARSALQRAGTLKPPFPPVYRALLNEYWLKPDWDDRQKIEACNQLAQTCDDQGSKALGAELRGRSLLLQNDPAGAARAFAQAQALGNRSPDLALMQARAIYKKGDDARAEQLIWKLLSDWPQYEEAYSELFGLYINRRQVDPALNVLRRWLDANPASVDARLLEAAIYSQLGQSEGVQQAKQILQTLFAEQPDNAEVLRAMLNFYQHYASIDQFITKLEDERTRNPDNREAVETLVQIYVGQKRLPEASRVLDSLRAAVAKDADLLYYVAHLYELVDQKQTTEQILQDVVRLDPRHAAASNDLGYQWADEGRNLDKAEALVRVAVTAEPDNQSYLDSMAWVEYKRGKFNEAREFLDRAIGPANRPDPVVLDHLGDTLYRLQRNDDAVKQWQRSLKRLDDDTSAGADARDDLKQLRLQLKKKLDQQQRGEPVNVAPVLEGPTAQAKSPTNN